ncbi:hypothetical protein D3C84_994370 [compost metagenome]
MSEAGKFSGDCSRIYGTKKLPQLPEKVKIATVQMPGIIKGATTFLMPTNTEAPSIHAASSSSEGTESMKFLSIHMPYGIAEATKKRMTPKILLYSFKVRNN